MLPFLCFSGVACIAATVATDLAAPDCHKGTRIAVRTAPGENIPIGSLDNGKNMTGALVGHFSSCVCLFLYGAAQSDTAWVAMVIPSPWSLTGRSICVTEQAELKLKQLT